MNILFIGSVKFSGSMLDLLISIKANVVGVCTKKESKFNSDHFDLSILAKKANIPYIYCEDINNLETIDWIKSKNPDIVFCFGWSRLLKKSLLKAAPLGVLGFHPAAIPSNRGRHPLIWALVLGLSETASTFYFMDESADSGDILSQKSIIISPNDNAEELYKKVIKTASMQIREFVVPLSQGNYKRLSQRNENSNFWRKRNEADGLIDWRMAAISIHNLVRGLSKPYVGAHFRFNEKDIKVWKTKIVPYAQNNIEPGKVLSVEKDCILVKTGIDAILLCDFNPSIVVKFGDYL